MEFRFRLKEMREEKNMTQTQMANLLGIKLRAYQTYEYGESFPTYKSLLILANFFNVSLDYLTGRSDVRDIAR